MSGEWIEAIEDDLGEFADGVNARLERQDRWIDLVPEESMWGTERAQELVTEIDEERLTAVGDGPEVVAAVVPTPERGTIVRVLEAESHDSRSENRHSQTSSR